jgi:predicted DsbA family dithiol-disulfide isomerase
MGVVPLTVEIWSDVVCPWCYIGKRRFEAALSRFERADEVEVRWRSFELDPHAAQIADGDPVQRLADKYGMSYEQAAAMDTRTESVAVADGLEYHLHTVKPGNTFDAHRVLHLAAERGVQDAVKERFLRGYFTDNEAVGDHEVLVKLAAEAGLDADEVREVLATDRFAGAVRADESQALAYGITGVPFFVLDERLGVSGAQPPDVLLQALREALPAARPLAMVRATEDDAGSARACDGDSCAI